MITLLKRESENVTRRRWWKNTAGREHRRRGGHTVADQCSLCGVRFQQDSRVYTYVVHHVYGEFRLAQNLTKQNILRQIKAKRLGWFGHIQRKTNIE
jgi:hypothetical protein